MNDNILVADIEGYAAIFGERDLNGDIIAPGAFRATLARRKSIKMLYQHAAEAPIGRWTAFHEDGRGLYAVGEILIGSRQARDVYALLAGAALSGLSIGYKTVKAEKTSIGRRILEADLWEVSIVTFPMAPRAQVTFVGDPRPNTSPPNPHRAPTPEARLARHGAQTVAGPLARAGGRAPVSPLVNQTGARQFADALRSAARIVSV